jgi:multidrug efflux system outer membrane protein
MNRTHGLRKRFGCGFRYGVVSSAFVLTSCATGVPQVLGPQFIPDKLASPAQAEWQVWPDAQWWRNFGSQELSDLIARAQPGNLDIAAATARVLEAQAQTTIQGSALWPKINLQAQATRSVASTTTPLLSGQTQVGDNEFTLSTTVSYPLDVWGQARATQRAAREALKSARFAQQALTLTVIVEVADTYFQILSLRERLSIAKDDIAAINSILDVIKLKVSTGKSSHLEFAQEQAQLEAEQTQLALLEEQELEARLILSTLLGQLPEQVQISAQNADAIQSPAVSPGLSSELLVRRPDVAQAEANLAAAHANLDAARAAFFPQFSLTGTGGYASASVQTLLRGSNFVWDAGASVLQTVFDGGTLVGQRRLADATQMELIASYRSAVLNAYADVRTALGQVSSNLMAKEHLLREVDAAREAFEISELQYRQGAGDLLLVLQAQETLFGAKDQLSQTSLAHSQAIAHLYEALGGGWRELEVERTQLTQNRGP